MRALVLVAVVSLLWPVPQADDTASFADFLAGVRAEARGAGISDATLDLALDGLSPEPVVVARDRAQPELTQSLDTYVARRLTRSVTRKAREMAASQKTLLARVEQAYGVPDHVMIAVWGIESNFGGFTGSYPTIKALATLAYDARRPIFRAELIHALTIIDRGGLQPSDLKGSWAGAMGQPQFMPSSFLKHAVDFDGDGRTDIWTSRADVFASMANFLKNSGWTAGERWGREVRLTAAARTKVDRDVPMRTTGCRARRELTVERPLSEWRALGVTLATGAPLPNGTMTASLVRGDRRHFLVYRNFDALLEYNCSNAYAVAVGLLADAAAR